MAILEAFFGGLFAFAMQVTTKIVHSSIQIIRDELGLGKQPVFRNPSSYRASIEASASNLQEIDAEITGRQRSIASRPKAADQSESGWRPLKWCKSPGPPCRLSQLGGSISGDWLRLVLQEVGRSVSLVLVLPQPDEPCPRPIVPHLSWHRYLMAALPVS